MASTRADDKLLGFEYQFYYFILELLNMDKGDSVGFEVQDDVHTIKSNGNLSLIQLKHTTSTQADGIAKKLTSSDSDLWKTLSNWIDVINSKNNKLEFIKNTNFILITNKSIDNKNIFIKALDDLNKNKDIASFKNKLLEYKDKSDKKINKYINSILSLENELLENLISKIQLKFSYDNLIIKIRDTIKYKKSLNDNEVESIFNELVGLYKYEFFKYAKSRVFFEINVDKFYMDTLPIFNRIRSDRLIFTRDNIEIQNEEELHCHKFAKQLLGIGFEYKKVLEANNNKIYMATNINKFLQNGEITDKDKEQLDENTISSWKEEFDDIYLDDEDKNDKSAKKLYLKVIKKDLDLAGHKIEMKNAIKGQFILMSDIPKIGWKHNWESEYNDKV